MEKDVFIFHSPQDPMCNGLRATVVGRYNNGVLKIGVSRCSERDMFCRKTGRDLAFKRLDDGKEYLSVNSDNMDLTKFIKIAQAISEAVLTFGVDTKIKLVEETIFLYDVI